MNAVKPLTNWLRRERYLVLIALVTATPCLILLKYTGALSPIQSSEIVLNNILKNETQPSTEVEEKKEQTIKEPSSNDLTDVSQPMYY